MLEVDCSCIYSGEVESCDEKFIVWAIVKSQVLIFFLFVSFNIVFNPLTTTVPHHIENSQSICAANQLTGFYMM